jgi:hypothetical protein
MTTAQSTKKPALFVVEKVKKGDTLIEGASIADGELALGRDLLGGLHAMARV